MVFFSFNEAKKIKNKIPSCPSRKEKKVSGSEVSPRIFREIHFQEISVSDYIFDSRGFSRDFYLEPILKDV